MYTIWSFFTRKKNFSYLVLTALTIVGIFAVVTIQKESNPEVQVAIGIVSTSLPGASASDIESLITNKIERALTGSLENVSQITSVSRSGVSSITIEFDANADLDTSIQDLKDRVDTVAPELPSEASDPYVAQIDFAEQPVLTFAVAGNLLPSEFTKLGTRLENELEVIPGVSSVSTAGLREREVNVVVNTESLRAYNLGINEVTAAIRRANATLPIGSITFGNVGYNLQFEAAIEDPAEIANVPITTFGGQPVYVRDVALISDGLAETASLARVSIDGEPSRPSITLNVQKNAGGNVTDITTAVNERLAELQEPGEMLADMDVLTIFDTGDLLIKDLTSLTSSGVMAVTLVMIILLLTLGWRESLVAGLSIPLSFLIAFIGLLVSGNTLNFISLFALILSVGILVDSAIVIVEGIHANMKRDLHGDKREAALNTIRAFHKPVTAGTMTTVAVFVPLFFISGIVGEFIKSIPFTIVSVLLASLLVALGFIPMIASLLLRRRTTSRLEEQQEAYTTRALNWYKTKLALILGNSFRENIFLAIVIGLFFATPVLPIKGVFATILFCALVSGTIFFFLQRNARWFVTYPAVVVSLIVGGILVAFLPAFATMKVEFFPVGDEDYLIVEVELPEGTTLDATELEARKVEEILYTEPDIASYVMTVGASSAFSGTGGAGGSKYANAFIQLDEDRDMTSIELGDELTEKFAVIESSDVRVSQIASGPPVGTPIVVSFKGDDLNELEQLAIDSARILRDIEGTGAITTSTRDDNTEFVFTIDRAQASKLGLDPQTIAQTLRTSIEGSEAISINTDSEDIDVIVKLALNPSYRDVHRTNEVTVDAVSRIEVPTQNGPVLLGSVLETDIRKSNTAIQHEDGDRIATVESELSEGGNVAVINETFRTRAEAELVIPDGVEMIIGGENQETDQSFAEMGYAVLAGLIAMFAIIVLMFNSFRHATYVILPAFFSFVGIAVGLTLTGNALSFPSLMGLIALVGIVVNNSIILIDVMNGLRGEHPEWSMKDIVLEGSSQRLRPITLTTLTTVIGIVPLLFASSLWAPLAMAIIFGLSFSVLITLILIPVIYLRNPGTVE